MNTNPMELFQKEAPEVAAAFKRADYVTGCIERS
jgi:hypothetical protein